MPYHVDGDFTDFGVAMLLAKSLDALLFLGDLGGQHGLQVRAAVAELPEDKRQLGRDFLKRNRSMKKTFQNQEHELN